ncbi:MAG TPA: sugar phosphate isomerase/epimerase [Galbitalea sp.]|nr:sugar phosphate isomerase/epimerase [Galbitalea sp.]
MIRVGMSTSCVFPLPLEDAFRLASIAGFDGVEIMVTGDKATQDVAALRSLSRSYRMPILSIHAPVLLATQLVWGVRPQIKLERSAALARDVGASTVVVHPPFIFQAAYSRVFEQTVEAVGERYGVEVAVENMFTWTIGGRDVRAYSPSPYPTDLNVSAMTLDFSHAALARRDSLEFALAMGSRLRHLHLCDGLGTTLLDEHLIPGRGSQPVAEVLAYLVRAGWNGSLVAEVHTHRARTTDARLAILAETLDFARTAIAPRVTTRSPVPARGRERAGLGERRAAR